MPGRRGLRAVPLPKSSAVPLPKSSARPDMPMETKLHAPSLRRELVERRSLISVLAATAAKLVLIEAPAGFGKTTLAAQWRASMSQERRFAWVCIDRGDDDPGRLWWHIAHALQRACPASTLMRFSGRFGPRSLTSPARSYPLLVQELAAFEHRLFSSWMTIS